MRYWWVGPVFVLVLILGYSDPHAGASAAAPLPVAQAEEPRQGTPTPTPTVSCCPQPWSQRYESCAPGATPGTFNLTYRIELYNQCPHPIVGTAQDTLRVSTDYSHWDVLATSTPRPIVIPTLTPPGLPPSYSG